MALPRCPTCGRDAPVEWDTDSRGRPVYICEGCDHQWMGDAVVAREPVPSARQDWPKTAPSSEDVRAAHERSMATGSREPLSQPPFPFGVEETEPGKWRIWVPLRASSQDEAIAAAWGVYLTIQQERP